MKLPMISNIKTLNNWFDKPLTSPLIIAGPCSAESEQQVLETAKAIKANNNSTIFRCGIWKPRTRPNSFEGIGNVGLDWLIRVKKETGMLVATEVATASHVEAAIEMGIDLLWIGARTTTNPFSVSEIAEALKGINIPVLVKNPVNPDLQLWIGALERVANAGITRVGAIHRGFNTYGKKQYKNAPLWEIPIELKRSFPSLPIIIDPSHLGGSRDLLLEISQKALDLNMDGLMIETHNNPNAALSDAAQQITPNELSVLISKLKLRTESTENAGNELEEYRNIIDDLDDQIINILQKRMQVCEQIGEYKFKNNITILQLKRWNKIFENRINKGISLGLDPIFLQKLMELVHKESIQVQESVMKLWENNSLQK